MKLSPVASLGALIISSASKPVIYRSAKNARASATTVSRDQAKIVTVLDGLAQPTAIEPAGDTLWVGDAPKTGRSRCRCRNS